MFLVKMYLGKGSHFSSMSTTTVTWNNWNNLIKKNYFSWKTADILKVSTRKIQLGSQNPQILNYSEIPLNAVICRKGIFLNGARKIPSLNLIFRASLRMIQKAVTHDRLTLCVLPASAAAPQSSGITDTGTGQKEQKPKGCMTITVVDLQLGSNCWSPPGRLSLLEHSVLQWIKIQSDKGMLVHLKRMFNCSISFKSNKPASCRWRNTNGQLVCGQGDKLKWLSLRVLSKNLKGLLALTGNHNCILHYTFCLTKKPCLTQLPTNNI